MRPSSAEAGPAPALWTALAVLAIVTPTLVAFNVPPSATFLNQAAALIGWGAWLTAMALVLPAVAARWPVGRSALTAMFALLGLAAAASPFRAALPWSLAASSMGLIAAAGLTVSVGAALQTGGQGAAAFRALCIALVVAGVCSSAIGVVQVFAPGLADGDLIARSVLEGRAVGNLRQPNHLSSLLLWAIVAAVWLGQARVIHRVAAGVLALVFVFTVVLSASRTGALGSLMLALWGLADRRLSRRARLLLVLLPVAYAAFWLGTSAWADQSHHVFGGETRFSGGGDISSSRFGIWSNTLALIAAHPWAGVGYGEFNFAWTLTPFPGRPVAFFDHTHNLPLQWAVELGLPLAALLLALWLFALGAAGWRAWRVARGPAREGAVPLLPAAFMMVAMVSVHSLLEYPLWYAYFLLPACFAFGLCLGSVGGATGQTGTGGAVRADGRPAVSLSAPRAAGAGRRPLAAACAALAFGGVFSLYDYNRVVAIFAPAPDAAPLSARIEDGRRSVFFAHHADYAAATTVPHPSSALVSFRHAAHYLLDARLTMAWAIALNEAGDVDRARYVAQRLKEFRNPQSEAFFKPCDEPPLPGASLPFQCLLPKRQWSYGDFR